MDWKRMSAIGFRWVICACSEDPGYDPFPLKFLTRIGLTDLSERGQPDNPGEELEQIETIESSREWALLAGSCIAIGWNLC
jgi:hypothetical protein